MIHVEDKRLTLPDGRTLAYADSGNTSSKTLVIVFHDLFDVGNASRAPIVLLQRQMHYVAPTLPGWGSSSPVPTTSSYATTLANDITSLIKHLHPKKTNNLKLYLCGISFGTIAAQMLYSAPYDVFPLGRQISGVLLIAPQSPPHCHSEYAKCMTWENYIVAGPAARYIPFNPFIYLAKLTLAPKLKSPDAAKEFIRRAMFDELKEHELVAFERYRKIHGLAEGQLESEMAANAVLSVATTWQGFLDLPDIYHYGWSGLTPDRLDDEHSRPAVLVVSPRSDRRAPYLMASWIAANYKNARLKSVDGGRMSALFRIDEIWKEFLDQSK